MKFRNCWMKYYCSPAQDGDEGGGGGDNPDGTPPESDKPDPEKAELVREVMKKKAKIKELETAQASLQGQFDELKTQFEGVDVSRYQDLVKQADDAAEAARVAEEERLKAEGKYDELIKNKQAEHDGIVAQMRELHGSELQTLQSKVEQATTSSDSLKAQIADLTVGQAFGNSTFIREQLVSAMTPERMRQLYGQYFDFNEDGKVIGYDKPHGVEGRSPISNADGAPVSFDEAIAKILKAEGDADALIRDKTGGGAASGSNNRGNNSDDQREIGEGLARMSYAINHKEK